MTLWDQDGPGPVRPVLVAAGFLQTASGAAMNLIGAYDGRVWRPIGEGLGTEGHVDALCVADTTGVGSPAPGIYAGGVYRFAGELARVLSHWDGSAWRDMPGIWGPIYELTMFDEDGPGPDEPSLFVGGGIAELAGVVKPGLVRWDGTTFSLVGGSLRPFPRGSCYVQAMTVFDDDGPGPRPPALYVAGWFQTAGGLVVNNIARWDGRNWEALGLGLDGGIRALAVFDADADGPERPMLYAGGQFRTPSGWSSAWLSRWDGQQWSEAPGYDGGGVTALHVFDDDGDGPNRPALFVGGFFNTVNGVNSRGVIKWDGRQWLSLDGGLAGLSWPSATAMLGFDEDADPATPPGLYVGGLLFHAPRLRELEGGRDLVVLLLIVTFAADTSAFLVGRTLGRTPLAPSISPAKTVEGALGGVLGAVGASLALAYGLDVDWSLGRAVAIGAALGVAGQMGDLAESRLKRHAQVEDSGTMVPGHGGALDRLDSIVFNLAVVYYSVA